MADETNRTEELLTAWVEEALELRHGEANDPDGRVSLPPFELGYRGAVDMLQRVRVRIDRIEELESLARRAKGRIIRAREAADFDASLAYDRALQNNRATRIHEYTIGDERKADATLASLDQKRLAHQMKRAESFATEALDVISKCAWGLKNLREDILQMMKLTLFATTEEVQT